MEYCQFGKACCLRALPVSCFSNLLRSSPQPQRHAISRALRCGDQGIEIIWQGSLDSLIAVTEGHAIVTDAEPLAADTGHDRAATEFEKQCSFESRKSKFT